VTKARLIYLMVFAVMLAFFLARLGTPRGGSSGGSYY
jgi:hypothetical protein